MQTFPPTSEFKELTQQIQLTLFGVYAGITFSGLELNWIGEGPGEITHHYMGLQLTGGSDLQERHLVHATQKPIWIYVAGQSPANVPRMSLT